MPKILSRLSLNLLELAILVLGLIVVVFLVGRQTFFTSFADTQYLEIKDESGSALPVEWGIPVTGETTVQVELKAVPEP